MGLAWSTYTLYKQKSWHGCRYLLHGNKGTKNQLCAMRQVVSNVKALTMRCVDVMPHQMKGIGDGWHDVQLVIPETWESVYEWSDEVQKEILTLTYVKTSFIFPNLIRLKFMLKVLGNYLCNAYIFNCEHERQIVWHF